MKDKLESHCCSKVSRTNEAIHLNFDEEKVILQRPSNYLINQVTKLGTTKWGHPDIMGLLM